MPVPLIRCRNTVTDAVADIPETALRHLTNWVPLAVAEAKADAEGEPWRNHAPSGSPVADAPGTPSPDPQKRPAAAAAGRSKAAKATTTSSKEESHG